MCSCHSSETPTTVKQSFLHHTAQIRVNCRGVGLIYEFTVTFTFGQLCHHVGLAFWLSNASAIVITNLPNFVIISMVLLLTCAKLKCYNFTATDLFSRSYASVSPCLVVKTLPVRLSDILITLLTFKPSLDHFLISRKSTLYNRSTN